MQKNATAAGAPPRTSLGNLTARRSPRSPGWFTGAAWRRGGGRGREGRLTLMRSWNTAAELTKAGPVSHTYNAVNILQKLGLWHVNSRNAGWGVLKIGFVSRQLLIRQYRFYPVITQFYWSFQKNPLPRFYFTGLFLVRVEYTFTLPSFTEKPGCHH